MAFVSGSARASRAGDDALVIADFFPATLPRASGKFVSAWRRNQHARARALPRNATRATFHSSDTVHLSPRRPLYEQLIEFVPTSPGLVISLALCCPGTSGKAFTTNEDPRNSMFCRLGITGVMAVNSVSQILARAYVAPPGFFGFATRNNKTFFNYQ